MDMEIGTNTTWMNESNPMDDGYVEDLSVFAGMPTIIIPIVLILILSKIIIVILVTISSILLIFTISYYNKLQTRINNYILNYAISNLLYMLSTVLFFLANYFIFNVLFYCFSYKLEQVTQLWNLFFFSALLLDINLSKFGYANLLLINRIYNYVKYVVYIAGFALLIASVLSCGNDDQTTIQAYLVIAVFILSFLLMLVVDLKCYLSSINRSSISTSNNNHLLFICNYAILSFLPILFFCILYVTGNQNQERNTLVILWCLQIFGECINYSSILVLVYVLFNFDRDFKVVVQNIRARICCRNRAIDNDLENF